MQFRQYMKETLSKILFGLPIALFFGVGVFVSADIIQPSFFKSVILYWPYFCAALFTGYVSIFLASNFISKVKNKFTAYIFMGIYMIVEALFSYLSVTTYYGGSDIPLIRQITALCLPLVFSLFYFLNIIEHKKPPEKETKDADELFKNFDELESTKPPVH